MTTVCPAFNDADKFVNRLESTADKAGTVASDAEICDELRLAALTLLLSALLMEAKDVLKEVGADDGKAEVTEVVITTGEFDGRLDTATTEEVEVTDV